MAKETTRRKTFRKVITSPAIIEKINPKNMELVERYLKNFSTKRSPKTVLNYRSDLMIFFCWNYNECENKFFIDYKKFEFMDFFDYCVTELKWNSNRFARMHSCLSSFSAWIENVYDERYPNFRNLLPKIEKPVKDAVRKKSVFTKEDLDKLMKWLGEKGKVNEQCLLALLMASGTRIGEVERFKTTMIDENNTAFEGLFLETTEEMQVKGRGVNGKHILRYLIKDIFLPYYKKWLPIREQIMKEHNQNHDYIFIKSNGEPAQKETFNSWMEKWDTVLDKHIYAHSLRHYNTTYLMSIGVEKELVQNLQSWSSDTLVDIYNDNTIKDRKWKGLDKLRDALKSDTNESSVLNINNDECEENTEEEITE